MVRLLKQAKIDDFVNEQFEQMNYDLSEMREAFDPENSLIVDKNLKEKEIKLKTFFDVKMVVKNKALHDKNYKLFENINKMSEAEAQRMLEIIFKQDPQFLLDFKKEFD